MAKVKPHVLQSNVWSIMFDPELVALANREHIRFQVYNVMNGALTPERAANAPEAWNALRQAGLTLSQDAAHASGEGVLQKLPPSTVVLGWLAEQSVITIPRTSVSSHHLSENAPDSVGFVD